MQEHSVTVAEKTYQLEEPFFVLATQNPLEMEGTYPLPEAQLDRFFFKVNVPFPPANELVEILSRTTGSQEALAHPVASGADIFSMRELARQVPIASHVSEYVARLTVATHPESPEAPEMVKKYVRYGSSPRGAQAMILGAKVTALLDGRYNVSFEDIHAVAPAALRHRLLLNFEGMAEGIRTDQVVQDVIQALSAVSALGEVSFRVNLAWKRSGMLFDEATLRKLNQLTLVASRLRAGMIKGERRSTKRGTSIEFADYRNYTPGDDLRRMD
jgi:MoxR-like ATPase